MTELVIVSILLSGLHKSVKALRKKPTEPDTEYIEKYLL